MWVSINTDIRGLLSAGVYATVVFTLYFVAGRLFLYNTHNMLISALSIMALFIIIMATTLVAYDSMFERLLRAPFYLVGGIISRFFQIKEKHVYLAMSALPSLVMFMGMMTKRSS